MRRLPPRQGKKKRETASLPEREKKVVSLPGEI